MGLSAQIHQLVARKFFSFHKPQNPNLLKIFQALPSKSCLSQSRRQAATPNLKSILRAAQTWQTLLSQTAGAAQLLQQPFCILQLPWNHSNIFSPSQSKIFQSFENSKVFPEPIFTTD